LPSPGKTTKSNAIEDQEPFNCILKEISSFYRSQSLRD
jgi:hypothetical protein